MSKLCTVVFTGQLYPGVDPEQAARAFAATFKVSEEQAQQMIRAGQPQVLKRDVEPAAAARYREVLEEIGWQARIDPPVEWTKPAAEPVAPAAVSVPVAPAVHDPSRRRAAPARLPLEQGWQWIVGGFVLFRAAPWAWIGIGLAFMAINVALLFVPAIGGAVSTLLGPVLLGGLMVGAREQYQGGIVRFEHLFAGFGVHWQRLLTVGGLYLLGSMLVAVVAVVLLQLLLGLFGTAGDGTVVHAEPPLFLVMVIALVLMVPLLMAYWFAPALVMLDAMPPLAAMRLSFIACWRNLAPFTLYGLMALGLLVLAALSFLLGLLVVLPVLLASIYVAYREIFHGQ